MTLQHVYGATLVVLAFGVVSVEPAYAQRRDGGLLPQEQSGTVTAVGCLAKGSAVRGGKKDKYVLGHPKKGPVASVPEATCTVETGADALTLDNPEKAAIKDSMLGKWVAITGRLEKETSKDPDDLRELDVASLKMVPVVPPKAAAAPTSAPSAMAPRPTPTTPAPEPAAAAPAAAPTPEAPRKLPKTASQVPAIGLAGLLSLAAGLMLRSHRLRQRG
jgi:LPXTG-motif cell wall-anchored protein